VTGTLSDRWVDRYNELNVSSDTFRNIWVQLWLYSALYGSEMWVLRSRQKIGNISNQQRFLVSVLGIILWDTEEWKCNWTPRNRNWYHQRNWNESV